MEGNGSKTKWMVIGGVALASVFIVAFLAVPKMLSNKNKATAVAIEYTWSGAGDGTTWASDANWDGPAGYPDDINDKAIINSTSDNITTPIIDAGGVSLGDLDIGAGYSGTVTVAGWIVIMDTGDGDGTFTLSGGTFRLNSSVIIYKAFTQNGGIFDAATNNQGVTFGGGATFNGGTYQSNVTGTSFCGNYTDNTSSVNLGTVNFGPTNLQSNITITGDVSLTSQSCTGLGFGGALFTNGYDMDIGGGINAAVEGGGIVASAGAGGDSTIRVANFFSLDNFTPGTSTVVADGIGDQIFLTGRANVIFNNLSIENTSGKTSILSNVTAVTLTASPGAEIEFLTPSWPHAISNLNVQGTAGSPVSIHSNNPGSAFPIDVGEANPTVENVDVKDSNASGGNNIIAVNSINSGNNTNWTFVDDPDSPTNIVQKSSTGVTIPNGGTTTSTSITYQATVTDTNSDQVQLCVETKPAATAFTNTEDICSALVASGSTASVTISNIQTQALSNGSYHWQSRAKDAGVGNRTSGWVSSGTYTINTGDGGGDVTPPPDDDTTDDTGGGDVTPPADDASDDTQPTKGGFGTIEPEVPSEKARGTIGGIFNLGEGEGGLRGNLDKLSSLLGAPWRAIGISEEYESASYGTLAIIISGASGLAGPISNSLLVPSHLVDVAVSTWNGMLVFFGFRARRKKNWGKVIEAGTGVPVARAVIKLVRHDEIGGVESRQVFATTRTDKEGEYRFIVPPGKYSIDVNKRYYGMIAMPQKDFYKPGNLIDIKGYEEGLVKEKIALSIPQAMLSKRLKMFIFIGKAEKVTGVVSYVALVAGSIIAINGIVNHFSPLNLVIGLVYILLWTLWVYGSIAAKKYSPWGESLESKTKAPVDLVLVRIMNKAGNRLIRTVVTDVKGKYSAILRRSAYQVKAVKSGYLLNKPISADIKEEQGILKRKIWLDKTK